MKPPRSRGTTNRNSRGSSADRRRRRQWLIDTFGNGATAPCHLGVSRRCKGIVTIHTVWVDRYPIPGCEGGTYSRDNIRPSCEVCNEKDGGQLGARRKSMKTPERQHQ